jgi:hypothetical protein
MWSSNGESGGNGESEVENSPACDLIHKPFPGRNLDRHLMVYHGISPDTSLETDSPISRVAVW